MGSSFYVNVGSTGVFRATTTATLGGGGAFTDPSSISGLALWLSADSGVAVSGTNVTSWTDQSANARVLVPDWVTPDISFSSSVGSLNSQPAIRFQTATDGGDVGLFINTTFIGKTVFLVYILESVSGFEYSVIYETNGINNYTSYGYGNRAFGGYFNGFYNANTGSTLNTAYLRTTLSTDGYSIAYYTNGTSDGNPSGSGFYNFRTAIVIGNGNARAAIGGGINQPFKGYIAEVVAYENALGAVERQQVEGYLNAKYAIY